MTQAPWGEKPSQWLLVKGFLIRALRPEKGMAAAAHRSCFSRLHGPPGEMIAGDVRAIGQGQEKCGEGNRR